MKNCTAESEKKKEAATPYYMGYKDGLSHSITMSRYNQRPPDKCPFAKGTLEEQQYDRGWRDGVAFDNQTANMIARERYE